MLRSCPFQAGIILRLAYCSLAIPRPFQGIICAKLVTLSCHAAMLRPYQVRMISRLAR